MRFVPLGPPLTKNVYGIREPAGRQNFVTPDLVLVPGRAFTADGHRLGAGGGYYDRFLARHPRVYSLGLAYSVQMDRRLPRGDHDRRLKGVLTARRVF
jgi:5-formyltetrahydrofolate cyclo-ligase